MKRAYQHRLDPAWLVCLMAVAIAITPEFDLWGIPKVRFTDLLLPVLLAVYFGGLATQTAIKKESFALVGVMIGILVWDLACLALSERAGWRPGIFYLAKRAEYFCILYLGWALVDSAATFERILRALLLASPLLSASVLVQSWWLRQQVFAESMRASGIVAGQEASTALFLVIILALVAGLWTSARSTPMKLWLALGAGAGVAAMLATGTRSGLLAALFAVLLVFARRPGQSGGIVAVLLLGAWLGWLFTPAAVQERILGTQNDLALTWRGLTEDRSVMNAGGNSLAARYLVAEYVWTKEIPESPLIGFGAGARILGSIDNFYLCEWYYHGVVGLILFLAFVVQLVMLSGRAITQAISQAEQGAALGAWSALLAMLVAGFSGESFYLIRPMEVLMLVVGVVLGRQALQSGIRTERSIRRARARRHLGVCHPNPGDGVGNRP